MNIRLVKYTWFIHVVGGIKKWDRYAYVGIKKVPKSMKKQNDKYSVSHKAFCVIKKKSYISIKIFLGKIPRNFWDDKRFHFHTI